MAWPSKIFVATTILGVYYTDDFSDPDVQPTWTAVNAGLPALDCQEFDLDPFDQLGRQYVLLAANETLYRRENGGNWTSILTPSQARTICGQTGGTMGLKSFCADLSVPGRLWALFRWNTNAYAIRSDDYGDNWTGILICDVNVEDVWHIRSSGNYVWTVIYAGTLFLHADWVFYSSNLGISWGQYNDWDGHYFDYNPLTPGQIYEVTGIGASHDLTRITSGGVGTNLQTNIAVPGRQDCMWFDYVDPDHHREFADFKLHVTTDEWDTIDSSLDIDHDPISFAPWAGVDVDQMIVGFYTDSPGGTHHVIGTLYGEADTTPHHIAGTNVDTPPYTDSIPYSAGNKPCQRGIRALQPTVGKINTHAVAMPGYSDVGQDRGIPIPGDRGAWDAKNYPLRHTNDINNGIHHTLGADPGQAAPGDHSHYLDGLLDVNAPAPDPDDVLMWDDVAGEWISTPAPGGVTSDHDHSGDPGDGGQFDADHLLSTGADDGDVLTSDGVGGAAFEPPPALPAIALDDLSDVNAPAPDDEDVLTWDDGAGEWIPAPPTGGGGVVTDPIWDAKGDLAVGTGADTASKLIVGANGTSLVADSGEATGLKWSVPAGGGDVVGPAGATDGHLAVFDGATGKVIKDGGAVPGGGAADIIMIQVFS